jgi:hypothetical protein
MPADRIDQFGDGFRLMTAVADPPVNGDERLRWREHVPSRVDFR